MVSNIISLATELESRRLADASKEPLVRDSLELLSFFVDIDDPDCRQRVIAFAREMATAQSVQK